MEDTALHHAARSGDLKEVKNLLEKQVHDANCTGYRRRTPLHDAMSKRHLEVSKLLLKHGANPVSQDLRMQTPLHHAAEVGFLEGVNLLITLKEVNAMTQDLFGATPLHAACKNLQLHVVKRLANSQSINVDDYLGRTPLHCACKDGHVELLELLLDRGAKLDARTCLGQTPLHVVMAGCRVEALKLLVDEGADVHTQDNFNNSPLHYVTQHSMGVCLVEDCNILVSKKLLFARNNAGETALEYAIRRLATASPDSRCSKQEAIQYLEGWFARLAVPLYREGPAEAGVRINPVLDGKMQLALVEYLRDEILKHTVVAEASYVIMGYLAPVDML